MSGGRVRILDTGRRPGRSHPRISPNSIGASPSTGAEAVPHSTIETKYSHNTNGRVLWAGGHGALLLFVVAGIVFVSGYWTVLLALGPVAYLLVLNAHRSDSAPTNVAICYGTALVIGWVAYTAIAQGIAPASIEPMSEPGFV